MFLFSQNSANTQVGISYLELYWHFLIYFIIKLILTDIQCTDARLGKRCEEIGPSEVCAPAEAT